MASKHKQCSRSPPPGAPATAVPLELELDLTRERNGRVTTDAVRRAFRVVVRHADCRVPLGRAWRAHRACGGRVRRAQRHALRARARIEHPRLGGQRVGLGCDPAAVLRARGAGPRAPGTEGGSTGKAEGSGALEGQAPARARPPPEPFLLAQGSHRGAASGGEGSTRARVNGRVCTAFGDGQHTPRARPVETADKRASLVMMESARSAVPFIAVER